MDALEFLLYTGFFWSLVCSADARARWRSEFRRAGGFGRCVMAFEAAVCAACGLAPLAAAASLLA